MVKVNEKLSEIAQRLWDLDTNRFTPNVDYKLDLQKEAVDEHFRSEDLCDRPLFKYINQYKLENIPTYSAFIDLLDNYTLNTRVEEKLTKKELKENNRFLNACLETEVMQETFRFLVEEEECEDDIDEFKNLLYDIWFEFYSRSQNKEIEDSSGFEHVFVGEKKPGTILGCHSWIQYYLLEKKSKTNYYGYFPDQCESTNGDICMLCMQFYQEGEIKTLGGFLVGVSPEFEIALYTILFLCSGEKTRLNFADMSIVFNCFKMVRDDEKVLATLFASKK